MLRVSIERILCVYIAFRSIKGTSLVVLHGRFMTGPTAECQQWNFTGRGITIELVPFLYHRNWPFFNLKYSGFDLLKAYSCQSKYFSFLAGQEVYIFKLLFYRTTEY
jgi:hypothetical protein